MSIEQWFFILSGFIIGIITCDAYYKLRNTKVGTPSISNNSKSTPCTCDYDGAKNKVVVYCGKCGGIVE